MSSNWHNFKQAYKMYYCLSDGAEFISDANMTAIKSGINNFMTNILVVDNYETDSQKDFYKNNFSCIGALFSFPENREFINSWSENIKFIGTGAIMTKNIKESKYNSEYSSDITVYKIQDNTERLQDYYDVFAKTKDISVEKAKIMLPEKKINKDGLFMYIAYYKGDPAGILAAVSIEGRVYSVDSGVKEEHRNEGILTALGEFGMQEGVEKGMSSYSALVTSPYTMKLIEKQKYSFEMPCDVWYNSQ